MGPSICGSKERLKQAILNGVNVCRINFSHGSHKEHEKVIQLIREINEEENIHTAILVDLQGPKIRLGEAEKNAFLKTGSNVTLHTKKRISNSNDIYISYDLLVEDVKKGESVLINDGKIKLVIEKKLNNYQLLAKVIQGGELSSNKGVNLPDSKTSTPSLTEKDKKDLAFALKQNVSWIALSFVRKAQDIIELKKIIEKESLFTKVIAKIEKPEALEEIEQIIQVSDAVMVARGDLGVEIPAHKLPLIQKKIVKMSRKYSKPSIIATQLLESMLDNTMPSRSDVNDIANAVLDGADALMLSGETSVGNHPIEAIKTMVDIIKEAETSDSIYYHEVLPDFKTKDARIISDSICYNSCRMAQRTNSSAIITMSFSGYTGFKISSFRPKSKIILFTGNKAIINMLSLVWGVEAFHYNRFESTDNTIHELKTFLLKKKLIQKKQLIINITSMPINEKGQSNTMKISEV